MGRGARPAPDSGAATAELAVAAPALALLFAAVVSVGQAVAAQVGCIDGARAGARSAARGDDGGEVARWARGGSGDADAAVAVTQTADSVSVRVRRRVRLLLPTRPEVAVHAVAVAARERTDAGSALPVVLAVVVVVAMGATALAGLGVAVASRHRAQTAADLGALAAAGVLAAGRVDEACRVGGRIVAADGARLTGCRVDGPDVLLRVRVASALGPAVAAARAGVR